MNALFILTTLAAPLYVWRFEVGGLPLNALMVIVAVVIAVSVIFIFYKVWFQDFIGSIFKINKWLLISIGLFGLSSIISLVAFGIDSSKFGQWVVLYGEPIALFFLANFFASKYPSLRNQYQTALYIMLGVAGLAAIAQYFTLWTLPPAWWGNSAEPKRAIGFFSHPNAFGLFVTPLLAWLIPNLWERINRIQEKSTIDIVFIICWALGGVGILLSLSRGAWFGLAAACIVFALVMANKKIIAGLAIISLILGMIVVVTPNLRYRLLLPFLGEKSAIARVSLLTTGSKMVKDSPILGKGINGFKDNWEKYNSDPGLEHYNFPHNFFLNFWIDSGLLGLISMLGILLFAVWQGIRHRQSTYKFGLMLFVIALFVHGLIDIPYFKNDLALVYWTIFALSI